MKSLRASTLLAQAPARTPLTTRALTPLQHSRTFLPNPFASSPQVLTASRILPYPSSALYSIISDVPSYSAFLPFCQRSVVTKRSSPDAAGKTWPSEAELVIGFSDGISESFHSRVYCDGGTVVEAVSGRTETTLGADAVAHHGPRPPPELDPSRNAAVLTHLLTRWSLKPFPFKPGSVEQGMRSRDMTEVRLNIEYVFANPIYSTLSAAAAPKVAEKMVEAFERRVRSIMDGPAVGGAGNTQGASSGKA